MAHVCLARVDRIGDLILTLPCERAWVEKRPQDRVTWLVHENLQFVMDHAEPKPAAIFVGAPRGFFSQLKEGFALAARLRASAFDEVIALHVPWWVALAFFWAQVKKRTGAASQWFSWIFFNQRLRQKRSQALKHEAHYNLDLVAFALEEPLDFSVLPAARLKASSPSGLPTPYVVIHPGMAGSARNWEPQHYHKLASGLLNSGVRVVLTGGVTDKDFIDKTGIEGLQGVVSLVGQTTGPSLLGVLSQASCVVAPSTGVAHLAASLGVPTVGIYSPVKVQAPKRWAPRGSQVKVFVPLVECPGVKSCLGRRCALYDCMPQIQVETVLSYVMGKL